MKRSVLFQLAWSLSAAAAAAQTPAPAAAASVCEGSKFHELDFWVGDWDVTIAKSGQAAGHNHVEKLYGGCGIRENWVAAQGGGDGGSLNVYDRTHDEWRQFWVGSGGAVTDYHGGFKGDHMELIAHPIGQSGRPYDLRLTFTPNPDGSVRQLFELSRDGVTWTSGGDLIYRRSKASPSGR